MISSPRWAPFVEAPPLEFSGGNEVIWLFAQGNSAAQIGQIIKTEIDSALDLIGSDGQELRIGVIIPSELRQVILPDLLPLEADHLWVRAERSRFLERIANGEIWKASRQAWRELRKGDSSLDSEIGEAE